MLASAAGTEGRDAELVSSVVRVPRVRGASPPPPAPFPAQDGHEDGPGERQKRAQSVSGQRCGGPGEDPGEPPAGPVHPHPEPAQGRHADHQLHHGGPAAHAVIAVRAHRPASVRRRFNPYVNLSQFPIPVTQSETVKAASGLLRRRVHIQCFFCRAGQVDV